MTQSVESATSLTLTRRIEAPRDAVYNAWTDPAEFMRWWKPPGTTTTAVEMDARVGGTYRISHRHDDGEIFVVTGTFLEVDRPKRLVYTWAWEEDDGLGPQSRVTVEFADAGAATEVTLTHDRLANEASRDSHRKGWTGCLDGLSDFFQGKGV